MYDELVAELRHYFDNVPLVLQAADAIEELQKRVPKRPHGRLIDADALATSGRMVGKLMMYGGEYVYAQAEIDRAPTIIPACEEGET